MPRFTDSRHGPADLDRAVQANSGQARWAAIRADLRVDCCATSLLQVDCCANGLPPVDCCAVVGFGGFKPATVQQSSEWRGEWSSELARVCAGAGPALVAAASAT